MTSPLHQRRRALSALVAALLVPTALGVTPAASAEEPDSGDVATTIAPREPLLDAPQRGRTAIRQLGDQLGVAAARNDLRPGELRTLLRADESVWVDPKGLIYYVDPAPEATPQADTAPAAAPVAPLSETFALHSNPGASLTILLDFDGASVSGTAWNAQQNVAPGDHPAWDPAGDGAAFSDGERAKVQQVWAMVAEDYAPFDVDVTTEDPGEAGMVRSASSDPTYGTRVLVTPSDDPFAKICGRNCGGVAYLNVFDRIGIYNQPAWVFPQALANNPKNLAEAATHEAGHNLGLDHDGTSVRGYYTGHGVWAPIMGVGYDRPLVQWSRGSYPDANNQQDDVSVVSGYLGVRPDEASGSPATPATLPSGEGVIGTPADVDAYLLGTCTADTPVDVLPTAVGPNLDVRAVLYDASGAQRSEAQPASGFGDGTTAAGLGASVTVPTDGAGWVLTIEGVGQGGWASSGYDDYGSLGAYTVNAPGCDGEVATGVPGAAGNVSGATAGPGGLTLSWEPPADTGDGPVTGYVVSRSGSPSPETLDAEARSHTYTGLAGGTTYQLSVRTVNATGAGPTVTVSATTEVATPAPPTEVSATSADASATVTWTAPDDNGSPITGYTVTASPGGATKSVTGADTTSTVVSGLTNGQAYSFTVVATNAVGTGPTSTSSNTVTPAGVPHAPAAPSATRGDGSATVSWTTPPGNGSPITGYTVIASPGGATKSVTGADTTSTVVGGLANGQAYSFTVVASNAVGTGPTSAVSNAVTPAGAPLRMSRPTVIVKGHRAIVRWPVADPNGAAITRYKVDISKGKDRTVAAGVRRTVFKGLTRGRYKVRVTARNAAGNGPYSARTRFRIR